MRVTVDIVENGFVATPLVGRGSDERPRVYVAKNVLDLAEVFEGLRLEDELLTGRGEPGVAEYEGLLSSMRGAGLAIVKGEGREGEAPDLTPSPSPLRREGSDSRLDDDWPSTPAQKLVASFMPEPAPIDVMEETVARANAAAAELEESGDWPTSIPEEPEVVPDEPVVDDVAYVPAAEDGYEYPSVRGPKNGKREILCPDHGWQRAELKDGAYRCMFKPSPRQVCQQPGTPKALAEKRLVSA